MGSRLILRQGRALDVLTTLIEETGAEALHYARDLTPEAIARDTEIKSNLKSRQIDVESHGGQVLFDPWTVAPASAPFYKVYSPMWRNVSQRDPGETLVAPSRIPAPTEWPQSDALEEWALGRDMHRGAEIVGRFVNVGEDAALAALQEFLQGRVSEYGAARDRMDLPATSGLSENLTYGEISPRTIWHAGWHAAHRGAEGGEKFVKELVWRDFSYHLIYHTPQITHENWRPQWSAFPWAGEGDASKAWRACWSAPTLRST